MRSLSLSSHLCNLTGNNDLEKKNNERKGNDSTYTSNVHRFVEFLSAHFNHHLLRGEQESQYTQIMHMSTSSGLKLGPLFKLDIV